jgi:ABC-type branched-subunit amino acid transport system substrate-binding protein
MYLLIRNFFTCLALILLCTFVKAADTTQAPLRIAVLLPLNLDSAFNGYEYNLSNTKIPQYFLSGLDFYNGVMMAIDTLQKQNANIEVWVYDTHKLNQGIQQLTTEMQSLKFSMIIASFTTSAEQKIVSEFSAKNSIPVISATFPNNIYLEYNPFFMMVNPTWKTHINAIYSYLSKNYKGKKVILFTRRGSLEDRISEEFKALNAKRAVNFSTIILNDNFSDADILSHLDSTVQNVIACGTLYEGFGQSLIKILNDNGATYSSVLMGMPTWNGMPGTLAGSSDKLQVVITTPYSYLLGDQFLNAVSDKYKAMYYSRPSDMFFKGYETMYHFSKLLLAYPDSFINNVSASAYKFSSDYDFKPVRLLPTSFVPDYLENKKIYYIRIINGRPAILN